MSEVKSVGFYRYEGYVLATKQLWMKGGKGPAEFDEARAAAAALGAALTKSEEQLRRRLATLQVAWESNAAAAAGAQLTRAANWSGETGDTTKNAQRRVGEQADAVGVVTSAVPQEQIKYTFGDAVGDVFKSPLTIFGVQTNHDQIIEQRRAQDQAASRALSAYETTSRATLDALPPLGEAPKLTAASAPTEPGTGPGQTGGGGGITGGGGGGGRWPGGGGGSGGQPSPGQPGPWTPGPWTPGPGPGEQPIPPRGGQYPEPPRRIPLEPIPKEPTPPGRIGNGPAEPPPPGRHPGGWREVPIGSDDPGGNQQVKPNQWEPGIPVAGQPSGGSPGGFGPGGSTGSGPGSGYGGGFGGGAYVPGGAGGSSGGPGAGGRSGVGATAPGYAQAGPGGAAGGRGPGGPGGLMQPAGAGAGRGEEDKDHTDKYSAKSSEYFEDDRWVAPPVIGEP